jgi:serine/threonine-protein kinase RsbW
MVPCPRAKDSQESFTIIGDGTAEGVRSILTELRQRLIALGLMSDQGGAVEIVLAEALNNIVEHAYALQEARPLQLHADLKAGWLEIELRDRGRPLPGLGLPHPILPDTSGPIGNLPEGGFGWYLIHNLTDRVRYNRIAEENHLYLGFVINRA